MIREIATLRVDPARAADFEAVVARARHLFETAPDCLSFGLERVIEQPGEYRLVVGWRSIAAHMEVFRNSAAFAEWRALAGPFFTASPQVVHVEDAL